MCHMLMATGCCCPPRDALQKPWVLQEPGESSTPEPGREVSVFLVPSTDTWNTQTNLFSFPSSLVLYYFFWGGACIFRLLFNIKIFYFYTIHFKYRQADSVVCHLRFTPTLQLILIFICLGYVKQYGSMSQSYTKRYIQRKIIHLLVPTSPFPSPIDK